MNVDQAKLATWMEENLRPGEWYKAGVIHALYPGEFEDEDLHKIAGGNDTFKTSINLTTEGSGANIKATKQVKLVKEIRR